jgi:endo-1,4-beta-xylanase
VVSAAGSGRVAALTFDDGPDPESTPVLLDVLRRHRVRATFCVVGSQVAAPAGDSVLRRVVDDGHLLAAHGMTHADMGRWSPARVRSDLLANLAVIREALGDPAARVAWFRAPNGSWGRTARVAVDLGLQPLGVTGTIDDWRTQDLTTLVTNLRAAIRPGGIVLAHDGGGDRRGTVDAVAAVLPQWLHEGWRFTAPAHPDG